MKCSNPAGEPIKASAFRNNRGLVVRYARYYLLLFAREGYSTYTHLVVFVARYYYVFYLLFYFSGIMKPGVNLN